MARSYKRDINGNTTATSEKAYKVLAHRAARRAVNVALAVGDYDTAAYDHPAYGDPWSGPKDGKSRYTTELAAK